MNVSFFISCCRFFILFFAAAAVTAVTAITNSQNVGAVGFGVSPSSLEFVVEKSTQAQRQLIIYNTGEETAEFSATSSSPLALRVTPEKGIIKESGTAAVIVTATGKDVGTAIEEISIGINKHNSNSDKEVSLSLGTEIAVKLAVVETSALAANAFIGALLSISIVLTGVAAYYASKKKARKPSPEFSSAYDLYMSSK